MSTMERATQAYLIRELDIAFDGYAPPSVKISHVAEKLVRQRRAREAVAHLDQTRWDTYMGKYLTGLFSKHVDGSLAA